MTDNTQEMDRLIEQLRPMVETADRPNLVLGAMVYWVTSLIKWSDDPQDTLKSMVDLITRGVNDPSLE